MPRLGLGQSLTGGGAPEEPFVNTAYLNFDGTDDVVTTTSKVEIETIFTLSCWVRTQRTSWQGACGCAKSTGYDGYRLGISSGGEVHGLVGDDDSYVYINGDTTTIQNNTWHFISTTYDGTTLKVYLAGEDDGGTMAAVDRADTEVAMTFDDNFLIGSWSDNVSDLLGHIDEVSLFNKVLSSEELATLYGSDGDPVNAGDARTISGLVGYYRLEEGTGTSTEDSSSTGNNGTLVNDAAWLTH